jgi:hypothetical protein
MSEHDRNYGGRVLLIVVSMPAVLDIVFVIWVTMIMIVVGAFLIWGSILAVWN